MNSMQRTFRVLSSSGKYNVIDDGDAAGIITLLFNVVVDEGGGRDGVDG